jgi:hypothetical protein
MLVLLPRRGTAAFQEDQDLSLQVTTAIAAADQLIRLETFLAPDADVGLADQAQAMGRSVIFPVQGASQVRKKLSPASEWSWPHQPIFPSVAPETESPLLEEPVISNISVGVPVTAGRCLGELEIAVSNNGQNVVIGTNGASSPP